MIRDKNLFPLWTAVSLLAYGGLVLVDRANGTLRGAALPQTIGFYLLAFAAYCGALIWLERGGSYSAAWVWGTAVLSRLLLLLTTPTLSDDVYRTIWDGHVAINGVSPYAYAVNDAALNFLDIPQRALVNNAWMASPYLPAAQLLFTLAALIGRHPIILQTIMVLLDLAAAAVIARLLTAAALPARRLLLYLWSPLVIVEVAHGAHLDAWMVLLTLLAVQAAITGPKSGGRSLLSPLMLSLATLTKLIPAMLAPLLFWRWSWPQRLLYPLFTILILLPFGVQAGWGLNRELNGRGLFGALLIYSSQWRFNNVIFDLLERALGGPGSLAATTIAKGIVALLLLLVLLALFLLGRRFRSTRQTLRLAALPFMAYILLTPTYHPWYLLILLAFLPFLPPAPGESRRYWLAVLPWLWLSGTAVFSYLAYLDPQAFLERPWVRALQWLPTLLLIAVAIAAAARRSRRT